MWRNTGSRISPDAVMSLRLEGDGRNGLRQGRLVQTYRSGYRLPVYCHAVQEG